MDEFKVIAGAYWAGRQTTFGEFVDQVRECLRRLQAFDASFAEVRVLGHKANQEITLDADLGNLDSVALLRGWDRKAPPQWFTSLTDTGEPTRDSTSRVGWRLSIVTSPESDNDPNQIYLSISAGHPRNNAVYIEFTNQSSPLLSASTAKELLKLLIRCWSPQEAVLTTSSFRVAVSASNADTQLGWLNYRSNADLPDLGAVLPATIKREPFSDGLLFEIGDGRPLTANNHAEVEQGLEVQAAFKTAR